MVTMICSTGGTSLKDLDDLVMFFENRNIPLAINHCVSLYPTEDSDLEMNQIDFLRARFDGVQADVLIMETTRGNRAVPPGFSREAELERLARERSRVQASLEAPEIYADSNKKRLGKLLEEQAQLARQTGMAEGAWVAATESLEVQLRKLSAG